MNWLKKIFGSKASNLEIALEQNARPSNAATTQSTYTVRVSNEDRFVGLDNDFINLVYFATNSEKEKYVESVEKVLSKLKVKDGMDYFTVNQKLTKYYNSEANPIPFLIDSLLFKTFTVSKSRNGANETIEETSIDSIKIGVGKLATYYKALSFSSVNLGRKVSGNCFDFQFEEELITDTLKTSDLFNYARINAVFTLGHAFYKANDLSKMENAFDRIRSEKYALGATIIAKYYRSIGEIYAELNQSEKALDWLKAGMKLDPKLGVKKLINNLET